MASLRKPLGLLIDLNGTIHIEDKAIKGSIEAVNLLRRKGIPFLFVTNTSKVSTFCLGLLNLALRDLHLGAAGNNLQGRK